ncbi:MAG: 2-isopropylmalate synthase [Vicinamibacterales bacterium]|jgi:2-isopropylmalate synthase|nr:2-isopropylmalate synthase [Acidobacteriota bacterium]MDP6371302.1 2-isopropylmalate synthase [Vicinamibacterales bacterium]MDP6610538.1 2-isopropylmalate synthase [Vicinamibacterales bacterium]HAK55061.1 2-isopropylmalate synthase [Acidobacteriota bacterium]|tara:strand:- start:1334 stop:2506 length:1173 start_codon:yes stop_codon:yes gene_type:complete
MTVERLRIFDTTLRDGEQAPGFSMRIDEKLQLARQLDALGVDIIEAGFPIASKDDAESVRQVAQEIKRPVIAGLARCRPADIECAGEAVKGADRGRIHTFLATSDLHLEHKLHMSRAQCREAAVDGVKRAREYTDNVQFSAEDALRTDLDFLCEVVEATIAAGATTINLPDTVGYSTPDEIFDFFKTVIDRVPNADQAVFSAHCHDDLGLAVANSLAALQAGVRQVECTINGIGERAGNASLEEIVMATRVRPDRLPLETDIDTKAIYAASQLLSALTGEPVQANKAIVGRNAFAHEAGIHQDGMLKDRRTYEIMKPEDVGVQTTLVLGKHSGRHAVQNRCQELGYSLSRQALDQIYVAMIRLADAQKSVGDDDLVAVIEKVQAEQGQPA